MNFNIGIISYKHILIKDTITYLIVAGGGAGGNYTPSGANCGGGGGGGFITGNIRVKKGQSYNIIVGSGGITSGTGIGENSSVFGITSYGGGKGADNNSAASNGGCGGGGNDAFKTGGNGISFQGYNGGLGLNLGGGGGGGAGGIGSNQTATNGGNGGIGLISNITGTNVYYSGGGGGGIYTFSAIYAGTGGLGGGGNGGISIFNTGATPGTNGLGGGGGSDANGGSGIVILSIPSSEYTGIYTGSPNISINGSNTILSFTSGVGSYTA